MKECLSCKWPSPLRGGTQGDSADSDSMTAVAVTGLGIVHGLGSDTLAIWHAVLHGIPVWQEFRGYPVSCTSLPWEVAHRTSALALEAAQRALCDSGLSAPLGENWALVLGTSRGNPLDLERACQTKSPPPEWLECLPHSLGTTIAQKMSIHGPVETLSVACASGAWAIGWGYRLIQGGYCQRVLVGGAESPLTGLGLASFQKMGLLASDAPKPFDQSHAGFWPAESAAFLVLERKSLAQERGAKIYGEIRGFGATTDAYHSYSPDSKGAQAERAIQQALREADLRPEQIDLISPHGTGTRQNDLMEAALMMRVYGANVPISATKGITGHSLGATGALECALCLLAMEQHLLPPSVGLMDPVAPLNFVRSVQKQAVNHAISHSFGFGGQNVALVFTRLKDAPRF
jgi:3-oxoacyl-[acyl-carrier-protein] synthase II